MSAAERSLYHQAVQELYSRNNQPGVEANYHYFVALHPVNEAYAHGTPAFLPWHRKYLLEFENALRGLGPTYEHVMVPYWDWSEWGSECIGNGNNCNNLADGSGGTEIFNNANFGTSGSNWAAGTGYATATTAAQNGAGWKQPGGSYPAVSRGGGNTNGQHGWGTVWNGPVTGQVLLQLIMEDDDEYQFSSPVQQNMGSWGSTRWSSGFRSTFEGNPHGWVHVRVGGQMSGMNSPSDPLFWSHHAFIDKIWGIWQDCHGYDEISTLPASSCASASVPCEFPKHYDSAALWDGVMPFVSGGVNSGWGNTFPSTWDTSRTRVRQYMKMHDLGSQSYMYEMDDFDKHMHDNAQTCTLDWHGFAQQQSTAAGAQYSAHFASSAQSLAAGTLPLNLDETINNPDMTAFRKFYDGAMCGAPKTKPTSTEEKKTYITHLADAAFRETSALAAGFGEMTKYVAFPLGSTMSRDGARMAAGLAYRVPASNEVIDDTIRMEQAGRCKADRVDKAECELTGGEWVPHSWTGSDTGANYCNTCSCLEGVLACTKMGCQSPHDISPEKETKIEYVPDPSCGQELTATWCTLRQHPGNAPSTIAVHHKKHHCRMTSADQCSCDQMETETGQVVGTTHNTVTNLFGH
jgi:tyrosinase